MWDNKWMCSWMGEAWPASRDAVPLLASDFWLLTSRFSQGLPSDQREITHE